ncbi:MAG: hypothetical protein MUC96_07370 [Myxococcaceae bacterium]|jgi:hypothetical protein|nr:hypothetical protein [Myxococcaceae bacterium]
MTTSTNPIGLDDETTPLDRVRRAQEAMAAMEAAQVASRPQRPAEVPTTAPAAVVARDGFERPRQSPIAAATAPAAATRPPTDLTAYAEQLGARLQQATTPAERASVIQAEDANLRGLGRSLRSASTPPEALRGQLAATAALYEGLPEGERAQLVRALTRDEPTVTGQVAQTPRARAETVSSVPQAAPLVAAMAGRAGALQAAMIPAVEGRTTSLRGAREAFEAADRAVRDVEAQAGRLAGEFGPLLTDAQRADALAAFRRDSGFERLVAERDQSAARLAEELRGASSVLGTEPMRPTPLNLARQGLAREVDATLMQLGRLSGSPAGREVVQDLLSEAPTPALLARATALAENRATQGAFRDQLAPAIANTAGAQAAELAAAGRRGEVPGVLAGVARLAPLLGIDPATIRQSQQGLEALAQRPRAGGLTTAETDNLQRAMNGVMGLTGTQAGPIRGLNALVAGLSAGVGASQGPQGAADWLNMVGAGGQGAAEAMALGLSISRFGTPGAVAALGVAGRFAGVVGAAGNAVQAYTAFQGGDALQGGIRTAEALGGVLMAIPSGYTQLAGGALMAGALATDLGAWAFDHRGHERQVESFLRGAGLTAEEAARFGDLSTARDRSERRSIGPLFAETAQRLGLTPQAFFSAIRGLPASQAQRVMQFIDNVDLQNGVGGRTVGVRNQSIDRNPRGWTEASGAEILERFLRAQGITLR